MDTYKTDLLSLSCCDCMDLMAQFPDKHFKLAIVDPPYGIDADDKNNGANSETHKRTSLAKINTYKTGWDSVPPTHEYWTELKRVSVRQIVWGANHFGLVGGYLYWHKNVTMPTYSQGELAWLSWLKKVDFVNITWHGMLQENMAEKELRIHPTQKPVALYRWLLANYAKPGDNILDTHLGSASSAIACHYAGHQLTACEKDEDYFRESVERVRRETAQMTLL